VEDNGLTIYDGDDPDLPMWMKWTSTTMLRGGTSRKLAVKNGIIALSAVGTYNGLIVIYFISDTARSYRKLGSNNNSEGFWKGNIAGRNDYSSNNYSNNSGGNVLPAIVSENTNDVAMTVLPNAPVDSATGLPIPTIAIATAGGTSVIKDDGTVVDFNDALGSTRPVSTVAIRGNDIVHWNINNGTLQQFFDALNATSDSTNDVKYNYTASGGHATTENISALLRNIGNGPYYLAVRDSKSIAAGAQPGMSVFVDGSDRSFSTNNHSIFDSRVAYVTSDYNTGWMHGNCKGAFLSDTDTTNADGTELVTNGTFASDSDWEKSSHWTISGGSASMPSTSSYQPLYQYNLGLTAGVRYVASVDVSAISGQVKFDTAASDGGSINAVDGVLITTTGQHSFTFTASASQDGIGLAREINTTTSCTIDNVSIRLAEEDRSVNNNALKVNGTITKTAVETGADLVAYSGFSNTNVLVQPYKSSLNPGTGDYSFTFWFKCSSTGGEQIYMRRFGVPTVTGGMMMRLVSSSSVLQWYVRDTSSTATTVNSSMVLDDGSWHCAVGTRVGATAKLYIDGRLDSTSGCSANSHDPGTTASLVIGAEEISSSPGTYQNPADLSSMALMRYSLSAPSPEQIKKIYEDEKVLFQENAKCTLYGSSDAVTALAYDDTTNLLHVGTSAGRSDFQGLRRINNTTTAVTTAISAHDEFIIEQ